MTVDAFQKALRLLSRRDHFPLELERKLRDRGYDIDDVRSAVDRCRELGYLNVEATAERFCELSAGRRGWGPVRLEAELLRRGVPEQVVREATRLDGDILAAALDVALRRAERRAGERWWDLHEARARMVRSIVQRGFDPEDARRAVDELAARRESQQHAGDDEPRDPTGVP